MRGSGVYLTQVEKEAGDKDWLKAGIGNMEPSDNVSTTLVARHDDLHWIYRDDRINDHESRLHEGK